MRIVEVTQSIASRCEDSQVGDRETQRVTMLLAASRCGAVDMRPIRTYFTVETAPVDGAGASPFMQRRRDRQAVADASWRVLRVPTDS